MNIKKIFVGILVIIATLLASSYLWHRFDQSDIRHAIEGVQAWPVNKKHSETWGEVVPKYYGMQAHEIHWDASIDSRTEGTLKVWAFHPDKSGEFVWKVQLVWAVISVEPISEIALKVHNESL